MAKNIYLGASQINGMQHVSAQITKVYLGSTELWASGIGGIDSYTKLMLHFDGVDGAESTVDSSTFSNTISMGYNVKLDTDVAHTGFSGTCLFPNGNGILVTPHTSLTLGTNDCVMEAWVRPTTLTGSNPTIFSFMKSGGTSAGQIILYGSSSKKWSVSVNGGMGVEFSGADISINTWVHICLVRSAGKIRLFTNGIRYGTQEVSCSQDFVQPSKIGIGQWVDIGAGGWSLIGNMDEVRISIGTDRGWFDGFAPFTEPYSS